jgi:hypothetical protein
VHAFDPFSAASRHEQAKQAIFDRISTVWAGEEKEKGKRGGKKGKREKIKKEKEKERKRKESFQSALF